MSGLVIWRLLTGNLWRTAAFALALLCGVLLIVAGRNADKLVAERTKNALALDANRAAMDGLHRAQAEAKAANERAVVWERNTRAVEAARAEQARKDAAKLQRAQSALQAAVRANREWSEAKVPADVQRALQ